jgi:hypothetical protein
MKKRDYCYWHLHQRGRRMKAARARARSERAPFNLPVLDDPYAVQAAVMQLAEAIAHHEVDNQSGRLLLSVLRLAASNLKTLRTWKETLDSDSTLLVADDPDFETQYDIPKNFDLGVDPEVAFPPPLEAGAPGTTGVGISGDDHAARAHARQVLRDARTPIPGTDFEVTADDMELVDVYQREGEQAGLRRAAVLERNRKRREARLRRMQYEQAARNRNIQLAAEKLLANERKADGHPEPTFDWDTNPLDKRPVASNRKSPQREAVPPAQDEASVAGA